MIDIRFLDVCQHCAHRETDVDETRIFTGDCPNEGMTYITVIRCKHDHVCGMYKEEKEAELREYCEHDTDITNDMQYHQLLVETAELIKNNPDGMRILDMLIKGQEYENSFKNDTFA